MRIRSLVEFASTVTGCGVAICFVAAAESVSAQEFSERLSSECGGPEIENSYGPYDYTNPDDFLDKLPRVERAHFDIGVESLEAGINEPLAGGDIDYTLRAFPNHHRALDAMGRYQLRYPNTVKPPGVNWSADCFFKRALVFRPEDSAARMIYGIFLTRSKRFEEAERQYLKALAISPKMPEAHHNLSLLYIDMKNFSGARNHAREAYLQGFPLRGAENKLRRLGQWEEDSGINEE